MLGPSDEFRFPPGLDIKYTLMMARRLARYPMAVTSLMGGANALNDLLIDLYAKNPVELVRTLGFDILLDPMDMGVSPSIGVLGLHELRTTEFFNMLVRSGSTIIDVGANVGYFTLLAATLAGKGGVVVSFEPDPTSFSLLSKSVERNDFGCVRLFQQCVAGSDGLRTLYLSVTHNKGLHTISRDLGGQKIEVESVRLDSVADSLGISFIDLLKIDAEGSEPEVIDGAINLISQGRIRNVIMEWEHPEIWMRRNDILRLIFHKFDVYRFARSFPFLRAKKLDLSADSLFTGTVGTNVYLRRRLD